MAPASLARSGLSVHELPCAQPQRVTCERPIRAVRDEDLTHFRWLAEVDVDVQRMLPVGGELIGVWHLHVLLTTIRGEKHALPRTKDAKVSVIGVRRRYT